MPEIELNLFAVVGATALNMIFGAAWFNAPFLFNRQWLAGIGKTAQQVEADFSPLKPLSALLGGLITVIALAISFHWMQVDTLGNGLLVGILIALGFSILPSGIKHYFEGRPLGLWLINAGHDFVIFALMGAILGQWHP